MANVTVPTPVLVAGGALCLLAGYLVGAVTGPDTPQRSTATVASYDSTTGTICLTGDAVKDQAGTDKNGRLCGTWRHADTSETPAKGDKFRFVVLRRADADDQQINAIYGDVVD